jgi:hypothetical protein
MPQIWLTYDELAALMDCNPAAARTAAAAIPLDRRRSRDGFTRAKLNSALTEAFLEQLTWRLLDREVSARASDLRTKREEMAAPPIAIRQIRTTAAR